MKNLDLSGYREKKDIRHDRDRNEIEYNNQLADYELEPNEVLKRNYLKMYEHYIKGELLES